MRLIAVLAVGFAFALTAASPASAGTLTTQNTCLFSADLVWRHVDVELSGTGSPASVEPGGTVTLTGTAARARFPDYLVGWLAETGALHEGDNAISANVWVALAAPGSGQGTVVHSASVVAHTTVTFANGAYQSSTPLDVTVPLPDSTWTAGSSAIGFRQAGAGTLPRVAAGPSGATVQPQGSAFISATLESGLRVNMDCQPGAGEGKAAPAFTEAGLFATVAVGSSTVVPVAPKPPVVTLRTTKLKRTGSRVGIALACADAPCKGTVSLGSVGARKVSYSLAAGARRTLKVRLSSRALRTLARKSVLVTVKVTNTGGKTVSKKLRLKR